MKVEKTNLEGVLKITLDAFEDHRGYYIETYNQELYEKNGINTKFIQDDILPSEREDTGLQEVFREVFRALGKTSRILGGLAR